MNDDCLISILTTFYRDYDKINVGAPEIDETNIVSMQKMINDIFAAQSDIEKHLSMLQNVRTARLELYITKIAQIPEDLRFFSDLIEEIGRDQIAKTTEDQKFVINGLQLKALMRLAAVGRAALSDLTEGTKDA